MTILHKKLSPIASKIRREIIEMLVPKQSHHIGCSLCIVEILTTLYFDILNIDPKKPEGPNRDIFILSKGHAGAALYATLAERGFYSKKILSQYDVSGGVIPEHVSKVVPGIELSTGSLGHGLPVGVGFAVSSLNDNKKNKIVVLISDGELDEGSNWEAIMFAGHHKLNNLIVIVDVNGFQGYGSTEKILDLKSIKDKVVPFKWNCYEVDGHDFDQLTGVFKKIKNNKNGKPHFILANTIKGKGVPYFEGKFESHYKSVDEETKKEILNHLI